MPLAAGCLYYGIVEGFGAGQMPETKRSPTVETRMLVQDYERLEFVCKMAGKTKTEFVREAVLRSLDDVERGIHDARETKIEKRLKAIEDRYAGLLVRVGIDVGTLLALMSSRIPAKDRKETMDNCYSVAVKRFNKKIEGALKDMKQTLSAGEIKAAAGEGKAEKE